MSATATLSRINSRPISFVAGLPQNCKLQVFASAAPVADIILVIYDFVSRIPVTIVSVNHCYTSFVVARKLNFHCSTLFLVYAFNLVYINFMVTLISHNNRFG